MDDEIVHAENTLIHINKTTPVKYEQFAPLIDLIECGLADSLDTTTAAIRFIGNTCIDNDEARDDAAALGFSWAGQCLDRGDSDLQVLTVKALYNICSDHEAAQRACLNDHVPGQLIRYMLNRARVEPIVSKWGDELWELAVDLLFDISAHRGKQASVTTIPDDVLDGLLSLPTIDADKIPAQSLDSFACLVEAALTYLRDDVVQAQVIDNKHFAKVWLIFSSVESRLQDKLPDEQLEECRQLLLPLSTSITWIMSDIAARGSFVEHYNVEHAFVQRLVLLLIDTDLAGLISDEAKQVGAERMANAACQIVGNVVWATRSFSPPPLPHAVNGQADSQSVLTQRMRDLRIALIQILESAHSAELLHSAVGLLIQLTRAGSATRENIGSEAPEAIERLCKHEQPELRQDAVKLLRALGKGCPENQKKYGSQLEEAIKSLPS